MTEKPTQPSPQLFGELDYENEHSYMVGLKSKVLACSDPTQRANYLAAIGFLRVFINLEASEVPIDRMMESAMYGICAAIYNIYNIIHQHAFDGGMMSKEDLEDLQSQITQTVFRNFTAIIASAHPPADANLTPNTPTKGSA